VSIGFPVYSDTKLVKTALQSLISQTYSNIEIIISDDCSDGSEMSEVIENFKKIFPNIIYFKQEKNLGRYYNSKFVLDKASGEYFFWANQDDLWEPDFITHLLKKMIGDSSVLISFCEYDNIASNGVINKTYKLKWKNIVESDMRFYRLLRFIWADIWGTQKANFFHGIMKKKHAHKYFSKVTSDESNSCFGDDIWFLFYSLIEGRFGFVEKKLFHKGYEIVPHLPRPYNRKKLKEFNQSITKHFHGLKRLISHSNNVNYIDSAILKIAIFTRFNSYKLYFLFYYLFISLKEGIKKMIKRVYKRLMVTIKD